MSDNNTDTNDVASQLSAEERDFAQRLGMTPESYARWKHVGRRSLVSGARGLSAAEALRKDRDSEGGEA